jgi:hypothetical protein
MLEIFQDYLDAVEPYLDARHFLSLERVLKGYSINSDEYAIRCCDGARAILTKPISTYERQKLLHVYICESVPGNDCLQ